MQRHDIGPQPAQNGGADFVGGAIRRIDDEREPGQRRAGFEQRHHVAVDQTGRRAHDADVAVRGAGSGIAFQ